MFPIEEPARHRALKVAALATGLADKAVSLFYEKHLHRQISDVWTDRCRTQIAATLAMLDADRAGRAGAYWFGDHIGHADVAVAAALRFATEAHPGLIAMLDYPALDAHARRLEALPAFQAIQQPFIPPA